MKKIWMMMLLAAVLVLCACGSKEKEEEKKPAETTTQKQATDVTEKESKPESQEEEAKNWYFEKDGVRIEMNVPAEPVIEALGEYKSSYEAPSCAFEGMDVVYSYPGFEVLSNVQDGKAVISGIVLRDDTVETAEGIYIGCDQAAVEKAYGQLEQDATNLKVTKGNCELLIILTDGVVTSIQYYPA